MYFEVSVTKDKLSLPVKQLLQWACLRMSLLIVIGLLFGIMIVIGGMHSAKVTLYLYDLILK